MNCKNCNHLAEGNFCEHCGQRTNVSKINLGSTLSELSYSIFQIDRGLFFTIKELFIRPGVSIREYLDGKRKNYFKPIAYVFTLSTVYFLLCRVGEDGNILVKLVESMWEGYSESVIEKNQPGITAFEKPEAINWIAKNYSFSILILLPIFSFASYLVFLKSGYNYFEHLVLNAYITGHQAIIYSLFSILSLFGINNYYLQGLGPIISFLYVFIVFYQFFNRMSPVKVTAKSILTYLFYWVMVFPIIFMIIGSGF